MDLTPPKKVVRNWKDIFPQESRTPVVQRFGTLSSRPNLATRYPVDDDPWRVGNQHARRKDERLANGATITGYVQNYTPGSSGYDPQLLQDNEYPSPTSTPVPPAPFEVRHVAGNVYRVQAGTCEGHLITTQDINVGSARPVSILAYPQYTLSVYSGEYVWATAVRSGAYAPVLTTSTSVFGDQTTVSTAGNEARALVAYIYEVDGASYIAQIAQGNISGVFADDGSLTGKIGGSYNKNF